MANALPLSFNPFPLGLTKVPSKGTAVQIVNQYADLSALAHFEVHNLIVQALLGNTGNVYVLIQTSNAAADTTNYLNVLAYLAPGQSWSAQYYAMDNIDICKIWIDADTNNNGVICSIVRT